MRIGYIVSRYPAVSHSFVQREVLGLRKLGWEIFTISIRRAPAKELLTETDRAEAAGTRVIVPATLGTLAAALVMPPLRSPGRVMRAMSEAWRLRRAGVRGAAWALFYFIEALLVHQICRREGLKHLHAHFANVASDVALIAAVLNGGTFSFTMHGPTEFFEVDAHRLKEKAMAAKCVICISDFARSQLMSILPMEHWAKLEVVHCGVVMEQFAGVRKVRGSGAAGAGGGGATSEAAGIVGSIGNPPEYEILCVARLATVKGHAILLQAVAELIMRGHLVTLTLVGDGPLREALEKRADVLGIGERVRFLGNVGQDVIAEHFSRADVFALPSFAEGVPVVLMEAMAARCPVVATRIAGISELVEHGATGTLVPPGRADLLADAMERLLVHALAGERMAVAGYEKVRRDFNANKVALQLAGVFQKHLEPRGWAATARPERPARGADMWPAPRDQRGGGGGGGGLAGGARPGHHADDSAPLRAASNEPRGAA